MTDEFAYIFGDPRGQPKPVVDPFQSEGYQRFVESMVPHCHCADRFRPCDGVLAGGLCDNQQEPDDDDHIYHDYATGEYP